MTVSTSPSAYSDCFDLLDAALARPTGVRFSPREGSRGAAHSLITRLNYARTLSRDEARRIYPSDDPRHGVSPYDPLIVRMPREADGKWWVYIEPRSLLGTIEDLP